MFTIYSVFGNDLRAWCSGFPYLSPFPFYPRKDFCARNFGGENTWKENSEHKVYSRRSRSEYRSTNTSKERKNGEPNKGEEVKTYHHSNSNSHRMPLKQSDNCPSQHIHSERMPATNTIPSYVSIRFTKSLKHRCIQSLSISEWRRRCRWTKDEGYWEKLEYIRAAHYTSYTMMILTVQERERKQGTKAVEASSG